ncbi:MAG TPA: hypothetical protein VF763_12080 [Candidatus Limnocylindrales bacterium]
MLGRARPVARVASGVVALAWLVAGLLLLRMAYFAPLGLVKVVAGGVGLAGCVAAVGSWVGRGRRPPGLIWVWALAATATGLVMAARNHQSADIVIVLVVGGAALLAVLPGRAER